MEPVQEAIFEILKWFPTDGTFNQVKPVERLIRKFHDTKVDAYSIDLSAATDRLPLSLQKRVMSQLLGRMAPFGGHLSSSHEKAGSPKYHEGVTSRPSVAIADVFAEV